MPETYITRVSVICPHCQTENREIVYAENLGKLQLIFCDPENGGCEKQFAYRTRFFVEPEIYNIVKVDEKGS